MERLTFDGNFCDIAQCRAIPCPCNNSCTQKQVWERLKMYEDESPYLIDVPKPLPELLRTPNCPVYVVPFSGGFIQPAIFESAYLNSECHLTIKICWPTSNGGTRCLMLPAEDIGTMVFTEREDAETALRKWMDEDA